MSSDSAQWPVVAPGFMYIVKMGDFTHILQPADQKSSEHLNLAQVAIRDINVARRLLNERGPFLLLDKQNKMDELICETENAINRVIKILEPSRVEHISDQSIRFNTRNPWALEDDPKSAATFSRLHITHDALKTVVHDLNNIEATAQLDDCETRANPIADTAIPRPPHPPAPNTATIPVGPPTAAGPSTPPTTAPAAVAVSRSLSKDARSLITWKRSRRAGRHARHDQNLQQVQSNTSSISETTIDDRDLNEILSPVSPEATRPRRASSPPSGSFSQIDMAPDLGSDASALPVIHELEGGGGGGGGIVPLGPVRPLSHTPNENTNTISNAKVPTPLVQPQKALNGVTPGHGRDVKSSTHQSTPSNSAPALRVTPPTLKQPNRVKRDTIEEYRQRGKESRQFSNGILTNEKKLSSVGEHEKTPNSRQEPSNLVQQHPGRFHSLKARSPAGGTNLDGANQTNQELTNGRPLRLPNGQPVLPSSSSGAEGSGSIMNPMAQDQPRGRQEFRENGDPSDRPANRPATYPPLQTQLHPPARNDGQENYSPSSSTQILSPSRTQMSPHEQIQSPDSAQSAESPQLQPHLRNPQIFAIDPELTKMPSVLRAARARQEAKLRPISHSKSKNEGELHLPVEPLVDPVKNPLDRSTTAPPLLNSGGEEPDTLLQNLPTRDELAHLRSMSETDVPQINVVRAPTIPRKPLPYRNSPSPVRNVSPVDISRIGTPILTRPHSEVIGPASNTHQTEKSTSGPPSPVHSDHPRTLAPNRPRATSLQSLSVQASAGTSRRSSISAEEPVAESPSPPERPPKTNGLAMNPPNVPDRQSAYQAQQRAQMNQQAQIAVQPPDYRSPAWRQAPHFDPDHNKHLGQASESNAETTARFRDSDQSKTVPSNHSRSQTLPVLGTDTKGKGPEVDKPPRPMAPAHKLLPSQQAVNGQSHSKPSPNSRPTEQHHKPSFLHHQAARLDARQRGDAKPQPVMPVRAEQVLPPQPQQAPPPPPPPRIVLTPMHSPETNRAAPKVNPDQKAPEVSPQAANHGQLPSQQMSKQGDKPAVKDKDLFGRQVVRPSLDKQPTSTTVSSIQATATPTPTALKVTPTPAAQKPQSHHVQTTVPQHDCHCDDDSQPAGKAPQKSIEAPNSLPQIPVVTPLEINLDAAQPASNQKKKKSWLAHHAGKIAVRPGN